MPLLPDDSPPQDLAIFIRGITVLNMKHSQTMNIVIPMAGRGRRFAEAGYSEPKPLIAIEGHPMVWWAVQGLPSVPPEQMIFIVSKEHVTQHAIDEKLRHIFSSHVRVVVQTAESSGQASTVLQRVTC